MADVPTPAAPAATPAATPAAAPPVPKSLKVKDIEFRTEDEAYAEIQRGRQSGKLLTEADKRLKAASDLERKIESAKGMSKKDLGKAIEMLGLSREEATDLFEKWYMETHIKPAQMDPQARRIAELEAREKAREDEKAALDKSNKKALHAKQVSQEMATLKKEVEEVLNGKKIPGTRHALRRVADYLSAYGEAGQKVPMQIAVDRVLADYRQEFGEIIDDAQPDQLLQFLGKERFMKLAKKVSQWALASSQPAPAQHKPPQAVDDRGPSRQRKRISMNEFEERLYKGDGQ